MDVHFDFLRLRGLDVRKPTYTGAVNPRTPPSDQFDWWLVCSPRILLPPNPKASIWSELSQLHSNECLRSATIASWCPSLEARQVQEIVVAVITMAPKSKATSITMLLNQNEKKEIIDPLDVSLRSNSTEVSNLTEITTISQREKEMDRALACLETRHEHPVNALLGGGGLGESVNVDTIPRPTGRPSITLQEYVGARMFVLARNLGFQQQQPAIPPAVPEPKKPVKHNPFAKFFQDRVETFARNMETLSQVLQPKPQPHHSSQASLSGTISLLEDEKPNKGPKDDAELEKDQLSRQSTKEQ